MSDEEKKENKVEEFLKEVVDESKDITGKDITGKEEASQITLRNGEKFTIPGFGLTDDMIFVQIIGHYLLKNPELLQKVSDKIKGIIDQEDHKWTPEEVAKLLLDTVIEGLPQFLISSPNMLLQTITLVMKPEISKTDEAGKPLSKEAFNELEKKWINERIGIEEVLDHIFPFLWARYWPLISSKILGKFISKEKLEKMKKAMEKAKEENEALNGS